MLQALSIRDFIIVQTLDLEFQAGFTTLTGETGAGKSILIDALSLALGARNEGDVIRAGCEKAEINVTFTLHDASDARSWLRDHEMLTDADELILRRVIYTDGRSRAFINGIAATLTQLKELGELLVDIYSQNAHHSLLKATTQRSILDAFGGLSHIALQLAQHYKTWKNLHTKRMEVEKHAQQFALEYAELRDRVRELDQLAFHLDDWDALQQEHARLSHGTALMKGGEICCELIGESETSALRMLAQAQQKLAQLVEFDTQLMEAVESLDSAMIQLEDTNRFIHRYLQRAELDPARLAEVELRIQDVHATARKYRMRPEELEDTLQSWRLRLTELETYSNDANLAKQESLALAEYEELAQQLSQQRAIAGQRLAEKISAEMQRLSLAGGSFQIALHPCETSIHGLEDVEFLIAGHAGVEPRALSKVASGGELSRISLALHVVTANQGSVPTMIFDEVDVGIGGSVAEVVGQLLKQLGEKRQVLVITHLPQVAAQALQHLQVTKLNVEGTTLSHIQPLIRADRVQEIARMLGGINITEATRQHAQEMLKNAAN